MSSIITPKIIYPESDGQPIAENTLQFEWIVTIKGGLDAQYRADPNVFVAGDLLWYPVEGHPEIRQAPDTMLVFGRPKGHRGSYRQWEEGGIAPQTVFEVWSPGNRFGAMQRKFDFYEQYGVDEYYIYNPDSGNLEGWRRAGERLREIDEMRGWVSPLLGIRFELNGDELVLFHPDGSRFLTFVEMEEQRVNADAGRKQAEVGRKQAEAAAEALRSQLRALGVDPQK